jgi:hypothetical protein
MKFIKKYFLQVYHSPRQLLIHALIVISICYLQIESNHETVLFQNIVRVSRAETGGKHDTVLIKHLMISINKMMHDRNDIFKNTEQLSFKARFMQSVDADLMYGAGACGGFSKVFARALKAAGHTTRIGQMKVNGNYGGHILLETYLPSLQKWVVMDPLFLLVFTNPHGQWASFNEVHNNWDYYKKQIYYNYNYNYNYAGIRYTNWSKIPLIGNVIYKALVLVKGEEDANTISLRPYLLDHYRFWKWVLIIVYGTFTIVSMVYLNKEKEINAKY